METNENESVKAAEESIAAEEENEKTEEIKEEAQRDKVPEDVAEETEAEEILEEEKAVEEEERREIERKEEIEEEIVEERIYTIPLRRAWISPRKKRTPHAVRMVKAFVKRHMKPENLVMSNEVNEKLWRRSIQKPPRRIRVRAVRDTEGTVTLYLAEGD